MSTLRNTFPASQLEEGFVVNKVNEVLMRSIVSGDDYTIRIPNGGYFCGNGGDRKYFTIFDIPADIMLKGVTFIPFYLLSDAVCLQSHHLLDFLLRFKLVDVH